QVTGAVDQGVNECENALQTITVAGNGTTYRVLNGASVTMIAAQNIRFLDGTQVYPGGYLHAYITTNGQYCCTLFPGMMMTGVEMSESIPGFTDKFFFRVYPNPTSDKFYIEMEPALRNQNTKIQIFNMIGELIESKEVIGNNGYSFFLGKFAPGIYLIQVNSGDRIEIKKIVKK
ncbi:MAG: T9SS type A sorting domain-containing protein, partial [Bacteroidetes bacterium]|nr:T9SS type A sorting domain-containing protein [Bacteroidota bacterium]